MKTVAIGILKSRSVGIFCKGSLWDSWNEWRNLWNIKISLLSFPRECIWTKPPTGHCTRHHRTPGSHKEAKSLMLAHRDLYCPRFHCPRFQLEHFLFLGLQFSSDHPRTICPVRTRNPYYHSNMPTSMGLYVYWIQIDLKNQTIG